MTNTPDGMAALIEEVRWLRSCLRHEVERCMELTELLEESGYRRRHQIEDDFDPDLSPRDVFNSIEAEIRVERGDVALALSIESKDAGGLQVDVVPYERGLSASCWSDVFEAAERAQAAIAPKGYLRPEVNREEILRIFREALS